MSPTGTQAALVSFAAPRPQGPGEWSLQARGSARAQPGAGVGGGVGRKQVPRWRRPRCSSERTPSITLLSRADGETEAGVGSPGSPYPQAVCPSGHGPHPGRYSFSGRYSFLSPSVPTSTPPRPPHHPPSLARPCASQPTIGLPLLSPAPEVRKLSLLEGVFPPLHPTVAKSEHAAPERWREAHLSPASQGQA